MTDSAATTINSSPAPSAATVDAPDTLPKRWTVMVLMGTEVEDGNAPMLGPALDDLREMAAVGSGDGLELFVQVHRHEGVWRGRIERGLFDTASGSPEAVLAKLNRVGHVDAGTHDDAPTGEALARFITWAFTESKHDVDNPTHCSMLVLWGHAYSFAMGHTNERTDSVDALNFVEIGNVLRRLRDAVNEELRPRLAPKLDIFAFDACDVATAEIAFELAPYADYLLSSQVGVPLPGWPYGDVLKRLRLPVGGLMTPAELGRWIVGRFTESYVSRRTVSLSLLDLTRSVGLVARVHTLTGELLRFMQSHGASGRALVAEVMWNANVEVDKPYIDAADFCFGLLRECGDPGVQEAARQLGDFVIAPPANAETLGSGPGDTTATGRQQRYPFVTASGRNAAEAARLNGVSLYAPHVAPDFDHRAVEGVYLRFSLVTDSRWNTVISLLVDDVQG